MASKIKHTSRLTGYPSMQTFVYNDNTHVVSDVASSKVISLHKQQTDNKEPTTRIMQRMDKTRSTRTYYGKIQMKKNHSQPC